MGFKPAPPPVEAPTIKDLYWLAGFLEGEGCFYSRHQNQKAGHMTTVTAAQVQREPLERCQKWLGGSTCLNSARTRKSQNTQAIWEWSVNGGRAAAVMMTLYPLMSPSRKEQIKKALSAWSAYPAGYDHRHSCRNGHERKKFGTKILIRNRPAWRCKACNVKWHRIAMAKRRLAATGIRHTELGLRFG